MAPNCLVLMFICVFPIPLEYLFKKTCDSDERLIRILILLSKRNIILNAIRIASIISEDNGVLFSEDNLTLPRAADTGNETPVIVCTSWSNYRTGCLPP